LIVGDDVELQFMRIIWIAAVVLAVAVFFYHRIIRPLVLKNSPYQVIDVHPESENVWTIKLAPPEGHAINPYLPGQFHFITFYRGRNLPVEEHHWTISSSPAKKGYVASTIKALGDFTATIGETRKGDKAAVHGAFGRFSYALHPEERNLVFIAGGIGITPLMSMLRHMKDTRDRRSVLLLYANPDQDHIVFGQELSMIERSGRPFLKIVHVLSRPNETWNGEKGHIDHGIIQKYCGKDLAGKVFYVCGPPGMLAAIIENLKNLGVADRNIRLEIFSFVD
jgi:ferredoxin-NADP reductase